MRGHMNTASPLILEWRFFLAPEEALPNWRVEPGESDMEIGRTLYVTTRRDFRRWLRQNHGKASEIWLVRYKKASGKPTLDYVEAVEEAICFGWIDNIEKSMDAERYALRFSPRRPKSNWTAVNLERARRMIDARKMAAAGLRAMPHTPSKSRSKSAAKREPAGGR